MASKQRIAASILFCTLGIAACSDAPDADAPDAGPTAPDAGDNADAADPAGPLVSPVGEWAWFDIPGAMCANGSQTGIAINRGAGSEVVIFLEGGGFCWNEISCGNQGTVATAANLERGYGKAEFFDSLNNVKGDLSPKTVTPPPLTSVFSRTRADNPYKDASYVYVPYCTGDMHSGDATQVWPSGKTIHYAGRTNVAAALTQLVPSFPKASRVTVAGRSAGGWGSMLNYDQVQAAFGSTVVDVISDARPLFANTDGGASRIFRPVWGSLDPAWNWKSGLPAACQACTEDVNALYAFHANAHPAARFAILTGDRDITISTADALVPSRPMFTSAIKQLQTETVDPLPNVKTFVMNSNIHMLIGHFDLQSLSNAYDDSAPQTLSITLGAWVTEMATRSSNWQSVTSL